MKASFRIRRLLPNVVLVLAALPFAAAGLAQEPGHVLVALGESLFNDVRLSSSRSMSCASCHRADRSFTEDKPHAIGHRGAELGRNTPTLLGIAAVDRFPVGGSMISIPEMVPLEQRVLAPLDDAAEMDASVAGAVARLSGDSALVSTFDVVFADAAIDASATATATGVTSERIGAALATYVRSLRHSEGPGLLALAGGNLQLEEPVSRGLELFREAGRCQSCHSGPGLTDGKLHVVTKFRPGLRQKPGHQGGSESRPASGSAERVLAVNSPGRGGRYGHSNSLERQTLPLVDVRRTAPYFRDGSSATLSEAVRRHVADLREIGAERTAILENPIVLVSGITPTLKSKNHPGIRFSPTAQEQLSAEDWIPANLTSQQVDDLVSFLESLSPG